MREKTIGGMEYVHYCNQGVISTFKLDMLANRVGGKDPAKALSDKIKTFKLVSAPIVGGMVPTTSLSAYWGEGS